MSISAGIMRFFFHPIVFAANLRNPRLEIIKIDTMIKNAAADARLKKARPKNGSRSRADIRRGEMETVASEPILKLPNLFSFTIAPARRSLIRNFIKWLALE